MQNEESQHPAHLKSQAEDTDTTPPMPRISLADVNKPPADPFSQVGPKNFTLPIGVPPVRRSSKKKRLLRFAGAGAVVLLLAVAYFFLVYLPNTPLGVFATGLSNTGEAVDAFISYSQKQEQAQYQSESIDGSTHVASANGSTDVSFNGATDRKGNGNLHVGIDAVGEKFSSDLLSIKTPASNIPDVYFRVLGIKHIFDSYGAKEFDYLDGKWIVIDHTVIQTWLKDLGQSSTADNSLTPFNDVPSYAEVQDALTKVQVVNKEYLFTKNPGKSVLANPKFLGTEADGNHLRNHYKVTYNKAHLEAYITAVGKALDSSKFNEWAKRTQSGSDKVQSLSQSLNLNDLKQKVDKAKTKYTFDLWVDKKTKLVGKLRFSDPANSSNATAISQSYDGSSKFPFTIETTNNQDGTTMNTTLNLTLDTAANKVTADFNGSDKFADGTSDTYTGNFEVVPGKSNVQVTAPKSAKPIMEILGSFFVASPNTSSTKLHASTTINSTAPKFIQVHAQNIRRLLLVNRV